VINIEYPCNQRCTEAKERCFIEKYLKIKILKYDHDAMRVTAIQEYCLSMLSIPFFIEDDKYMFSFNKVKNTQKYQEDGRVIGEPRQRCLWSAV